MTALSSGVCALRQSPKDPEFDDEFEFDLCSLSLICLEFRLPCRE